MNSVITKQLIGIVHGMQVMYFAASIKGRERQFPLQHFIAKIS